MSNVPTVAPFGTWKSTVSPQMVTVGTIILEDVWIHGRDLLWLEGRPSNAGRQVLVRKSPRERPHDAIPADYDVRSRVHEYGGGAVALSPGAVYFSDGGDQRIYRMPRGGPVEPVTSPQGDVRYADLTWDRHHSRLISVREHHAPDGTVTNVIAAVGIAAASLPPTILAQGLDFYMAPRVSPDGRHLAFLGWNHPDMPWTGATVYVAPIHDEDGGLGEPIPVAGGGREAAAQPQWSPDNELYFLLDRNGWWNIWTLRAGQVVPITTMHADFGDASWTFGQSTYGFASADEIYAACTMAGLVKFVRIDVRSRELTHIACPFATLSHLRVSESLVAMIAGSDREPRTIAVYHIPSRRYQIVTREGPLQLDGPDLSLPEAIEFPNGDGQITHGYYYAPKNRDYLPPEGERPPLVVVAHGGPTDRATPEFRLDIQYWTNRGFAVVDVNYGGSTGYGRAYRERLNTRWGLRDVSDLVSAAEFLARYNKADLQRLVVRGESAGGFTALSAAVRTNAFRAAVSYYGISDLVALTHSLPKFESHYLQTLVGPFDTRLYRDRSPLYQLDHITTPVLFFHGLDDRVVDPNQTQSLVDSLIGHGVPVGVQFFPGEGHGFSNPAVISRCLEAELAFYAQILGIRLAERVDGLPLDY